MLISKENENRVSMTAAVASGVGIASYIGLVIFTSSDAVFYRGIRFALAVLVVLFLFSLMFRKVRDQHEELATGFLLLLSAILPIFLADFLGGPSSPFIFLIFPTIAITFIFGTWWGLALDVVTVAYLVTNTIIEPTDLPVSMAVFASLAAFSAIFFYIGKRYREVLMEKDNLECSNLTLSANQNKEKALLAGIADGVYVVDMERNMTMFNTAAEEMTGWKANEAIGLKCWTVMNLKNDTGISVCQKDCPAMNVWNTGENIIRDDTCFSKKRGNKNIQISSSYSPIKDKNGNLTGAICVFRDVTASKEVERLRNEFVSTASHELRTPITAMEGYMELIENDKICQIDDKAHEYVTKARGTAQGMSNLVKNLLTVTKIEEGKIQTDVSKFSVHDLAAEVVEAMAHTAKDRGLTLKIVETTNSKINGEKSIGRSLNVVADKEQVREVFYNLVENGLKFTSEGGVSISIAYDKDFATVCITDTGMGIPADGQKHLFEKFYRYDNTATREVGGTGLGLFITRSIVEMFGGNIWLESGVGKGTKFFFTIPRSLD